MAKIFLYSTLSLAFILSGCVNLKLDERFMVDEGDWYTEGGGYTNHHHVSTTVDPPLVEKWRYDVGAGVGLAGALVIDGVILVGTRKGHILALDLQTGKKLGRARFEAPIEGGMTYNNSLLYLPFIDKKRTIVAYNIYDGDHVWRVKGAPVESTIWASDSVVVVVDSDALVRGFEARRGEVLWEQQMGEKTGIVASPVGVDGGLIIATEKGAVHKLEAATGETHWSQTLPEPVYSTPSVEGDNVFVPTTRGRFYSLSSGTGDINWVYTLPDSTVRLASPGYDREYNQVVLAGSDGHIRSLDPASGDEAWATKLDGAIITAPLFTNNTIYVGSLRGMLYALDRTTGEKLWEHKVTGRIKSAIVAHDEKLVVMAETQQLFVFETEGSEEEVSP